MELAVATFVDRNTQLVAEARLVVASTMLVFPMVNPVTSNRNVPATIRGNFKRMGGGIPTVMAT